MNVRYIERPDSFRPGWHVVNTNAKKEYIVEAHLKNLGYTIYLPLAYKTLSMIRKSVAPLFHSYLFVALRNAHQFYHVNCQPGVHHILTVGEEPALLEESCIKKLQSLEEYDGCLRFPIILNSKNGVSPFTISPLQTSEQAIATLFQYSRCSNS